MKLLLRQSSFRYDCRLCLVFAVIAFSGIETISTVDAAEYSNVRYLPEWRYAGDPAADRDDQLLMDIEVPEDGKEKHPVLLIVHGGGWSAGHKDQKVHRQIAAFFVKRGFVCVRLNYLLRPRGMFPQVFHDYAHAVRFLRQHARKYKIDRCRFGAIGLSAGGWLISSAGHGSGDLLCLNHQQSSHLTELWQRNWQRDHREYEESFARPMVSTQPGYPDGYGLVQAISYDFSFRMKYGSGNSPACNQWVGQGYRLRAEEQAAVERQQFPYSQTVMTHPSLAGRKVHVPPLFRSIQKDGKNKAEALSRDGEQRIDAIQRIGEFFEHTLITDPRTPVPEIRPGQRVFDKRVTVHFVMPTDDAKIRYRFTPLDSSAKNVWPESVPSAEDTAIGEWKEYTGPFEVTATGVVQAIATRPGMRESTVAEAHFFAGVSMAQITKPVVRELPTGRTGQRYSLKFEADTASARWFLAGDLVPYTTRKQPHYTYPNGMVMNYTTGEWSGVPTRPGRFWIQVWVNDRPGGLATCRDYVWTVTGQSLETDERVAIEKDDPFVELLFLPGEKKYPASELVQHLNRHGIPSILDSDPQGQLLLVHRQNLVRARQQLQKKLGDLRYKGEIRWQD